MRTEPDPRQDKWRARRAVAEASGLVLLSRSTDVFENLALEDWLDANVDLRRRGVLLLWRNRPAVVIGRHQNPVVEGHLAVRLGRAALAPPSSGGGPLPPPATSTRTFFRPKKAYDRQRNLSVVTGALRRARPGLDVHATERLDVVLNGRFKISGSNATPSVPSPVANLLDHAPTLHWDELLEALVQQYNEEFGYDAVMAPVDPADELAFPGVGRLAAELRSWDWTFGRTPKFSVQSVLDLRDCSARLHVEVKAGLVQSCELDVPSHWLPRTLSAELGAALVGDRFCRQRAAAARGDAGRAAAPTVRPRGRTRLRHRLTRKTLREQ
ncbi:hypothetical protein PFLUV_G00170170 [Perca fluviatilis]|uniref:BPL/LPL catalytic domain-containing protein n=1 Tax=Perca fluviatilis TaxID=8168 RepID=A0A6A5EPL4_PERFL|nr:hypothetical protein PFLUV_G00170170 [Perca fluviatilis]